MAMLELTVFYPKRTHDTLFYLDRQCNSLFTEYLYVYSQFLRGQTVTIADPKTSYQHRSATKARDTFAE